MVVGCWLLVGCLLLCLLFVVRLLLFRYVLFVVGCLRLLRVVRCVLCIIRCVLFRVSWFVFVGCRVLFVALLFVDG